MVGVGGGWQKLREFFQSRFLWVSDFFLVEIVSLYLAGPLINIVDVSMVSEETPKVPIVWNKKRRGANGFPFKITSP